VAWLASKLSNLKASIRVDYPHFNHWDFLWSVNVNELLYNHLIKLLPPPYYLMPHEDLAKKNQATNRRIKTQLPAPSIGG
jgi:hypothetical protein